MPSFVLPVVKIILFFAALFMIAAGIGYLQIRYQEQKASVSLDIERAFAKDFQNLVRYPDIQDISTLTFSNTAGKTFSFSDFKGKPLLVNFWATWCPPCIIELPSFQVLQDSFPDLKVIAISFDSNKSSTLIGQYIQGKGLPDLAGYLDHNREIQSSLPIRGIPVTLLIDRDGKISYLFEGEANWASAESLAFFHAYMAQKQ